MLYGAGSLVFVTKDLATSGQIRTTNLIYPPLLSSFEYNGDVNFLEAKALVDGEILTAASRINERTYTLSVTTQFADWPAMQFAFDELAQTSSSPVVPTLKTAIVGAAVSGEIADADITAGTAASVQAYTNSTQAPNGREFLVASVGVAAGAVGTVTVNGTSGKLLFNSAYDGYPVTYLVNKTYTSAATIGLESSFDRFGKLEFWGKLYGTEFNQPGVIRFPNIGRIGVPSLSVAGDVTELTIEFRASIDPDNGFRSPHIFYHDLV